MRGVIKVTPVDAQLSTDMMSAIDAFIKANVSGPVTDKAWSVYWTDGEAFKVLGFAGCNYGPRVADVPVYHIIEGSTREEKWMSATAHEKLFDRVCGFIADMVGSGTEAMFYIAPDAQEHWKEFAKRVNGRQANRFITGVA